MTIKRGKYSEVITWFDHTLFTHVKKTYYTNGSVSEKLYQWDIGVWLPLEQWKENWKQVELLSK